MRRASLVVVVLVTGLGLRLTPPVSAGNADGSAVTEPTDDVPTTTQASNATTAAVAAPSIGWEQSYGGDHYDGWNEVLRLADGGYLLAGGYEQNETNTDGWVMEVDRNGNTEWERFYGGDENDTVTGVAAADGGGYILVGVTISSGINGTDTGWVLKIDDSGTTHWEKTFGGPGTDVLYEVINVGDDEYVAAGYRQSTQNDDYDFWGLKVQGDGSTSWSKKWDSFDEENDAAYDVAKIPGSFSDEYLFVGQSFEGDDVLWDGQALIASESGNRLDTEVYGDGNGDSFYGVDRTADGNYVITGRYDAPFSEEAQEYQDGEVWALKIGENLGTVWDRSYGGGEFDLGRDVAETSDGDYLIGAYTQSKGHGDVAGWVLRLDENGLTKWEDTYGGGGTDYVISVTESEAGHPIITGDNGRPGDDTQAWIAQLGGAVTGTETVSVENTTTTPGTDSSVTVTLDPAPNGLRIYNLTVALENGTVADVDSATGGDVGGFSVVAKSADSITVKAADLSDVVRAGDGPVDLGTVSFTNTVEGSSTVTATVHRLDDDFDLAVSPATNAGRLTVIGGAFTKPVPGTGAANPPRDLDGDGTVEDVNGDGQKTFDDAISLAFANTGGLSETQRLALDFDGDGDVDFDDAIELAFL